MGGAEDGVVDEDAVYGGVGVGGEDGVFEGVFGDGLEVEGEAAGGGLAGAVLRGGAVFPWWGFGGTWRAMEGLKGEPRDGRDIL